MVKKVLWVVLAVGIASGRRLGLRGARAPGERHRPAPAPARHRRGAEPRPVLLAPRPADDARPEEGEAIAQRPGGRPHRGARPRRGRAPTSSGRSRRSRRATRRAWRRSRSCRRSSRRSPPTSGGSAGSSRRASRRPANLETLQHQREAIAADIRAREAEKGQLEAEEQALRVRARQGPALREGGRARARPRAARPDAAPPRGRVGRAGAGRS